jgi:predicted porin
MEALIGPDRDQSRIKMGFLPNYIGFNFSKQLDDLKVGGRSSFWVTINDSDTSTTVTSTGIDVRQFYGTVEGNWGQVLFGKDFTLFCRSNIFNDEILLGYGNVSDSQLGSLIDGNGVSFGDIGSGYIYPLPSAQITYRTPDFGGFKLAVGLVDPSRTNNGVGAEEDVPRIEGEATFNKTFGEFSMGAWVGGMTQTSKSDNTANVDSRGISYGLNAKVAGFSLTGSGFTGSGLNTLLGAFGAVTDGQDATGYLVQGSYTFNKFRFVGSYGDTKVDNATDDENETIAGAIFYTLNDNFKLVAEYNRNTIDIGVAEEKTDTIALGLIASF